jgi:hypothetical protein
MGFFLQQAILQRELRAKLLNAADAAIEADELRSDRARLQGGAQPDPYAAMVSPRARSALSSLGLEQIHAARLAAQRAGTAPPAPGAAPDVEHRQDEAAE